MNRYTPPTFLSSKASSFVGDGRVAQRESTPLTWEGAQVQSLSCPPFLGCVCGSRQRLNRFERWSFGLGVAASRHKRRTRRATPPPCQTRSGHSRGGYWGRR